MLNKKDLRSSEDCPPWTSNATCLVDALARPSAHMRCAKIRISPSAEFSGFNGDPVRNVYRHQYHVSGCYNHLHSVIVRTII